MHQVNLNDQLFQQAQQRALAVGFDSVDEYVAEVVSHDLLEDTADLDYLFTAERMAIIRRADADVDAGHFYTSEEAETELINRREEWLRKNQPGR